MPICQENCVNYVPQAIPSSKRKSDFTDLSYGSQLAYNDDQFPNPKKACLKNNESDTNIFGNPDNYQNASLGRQHEANVTHNQIQSNLVQMEISNQKPNQTTSHPVDYRQTESFRNSNLVRCHCFPSWDGFDSKMPYQSDYY